MDVKLGMGIISSEVIINETQNLLEAEQFNRYYDSENNKKFGYVLKTESLFKRIFNFDFALATTSATTSLILALKAIGVSSGDEVILSCYSFSACSYAILAVGAIPVVCPITDKLQIDVASISHLISEKTKAILLVHMRGVPQPVREIHERYRVKIIEDCSQFDGLRFGNRLGSSGLADVSVFSFQSKKVISAGEGGMVATNNFEIYRRLFVSHDPAWDLRGLKIFEDLEEIEEENFFTGARMNEITAMLVYLQLTGVENLCENLMEFKEQLLIDLSREGSINQLFFEDDNSCMGFDLIIDVNSTINLKRYGYLLYPESNTPIDAHSYFGWRNSIKGLCKAPLSLEKSFNLLGNYLFLNSSIAYQKANCKR